MVDGSYFREKAKHCRELLQITIRSEVREQLTLWAEEFDAQAEAFDKQASAARLAERG